MSDKLQMSPPSAPGRWSRPTIETGEAPCENPLVELSRHPFQETRGLSTQRLQRRGEQRQIEVWDIAEFSRTMDGGCYSSRGLVWKKYRRLLAGRGSSAFEMG